MSSQVLQENQFSILFAEEQDRSHHPVLVRKQPVDDLRPAVAALLHLVEQRLGRHGEHRLDAREECRADQQREHREAGNQC